MRKLIPLWMMMCCLWCHQAVFANTSIQQLDSTLAHLSGQTMLPVFYVSWLPPAKTPYYAYSELLQEGKGYSFFIDSTPDCQGMHYCTLGYWQAVKNAPPLLQTDRQHQLITQTLRREGQVFYYTPGHAMGDYFPATLQWQKNGVLYTISWQVENEDELFKMYKSIVQYAKPAKEISPPAS